MAGRAPGWQSAEGPGADSGTVQTLKLEMPLFVLAGGTVVAR